ncbi:hypothetical protein XENOCAPTIV_025561 [Xenoophorus captivus]|uniref:Uncharacterized protein n=1 Tax=Xenoophorus captivus TaxID=1517983 RepID=A0ABV0QTH2_9TELE
MEKSLFICSTRLLPSVSNYPSGLGAVVFVLCLGLILSIVWLSCGCPSGPATVPEIATILGSPRTLCVIGTDFFGAFTLPATLATIQVLLKILAYCDKVHYFP